MPGPDPTLVILTTNGAGGLPLGWASLPGGLAGLSLCMQYVIQDPAALGGYAISNALRGDRQ